MAATPEKYTKLLNTVTSWLLDLVQMSPAFKLDFSKVFLSLYSRITSPQRLQRSSDLDSHVDKLASMSVQIFTIPDVAVALTRDEAVRGLLVVLGQLHSILR
jgi:hypothetical protein